MGTVSLIGQIFVLAVVLALGLTRLLIVMGHRKGWVDKPKADRWSKTPTALFGGVAIFTAFLLASLPLLFHPALARRYDLHGLLIGGVILFGVGLKDDIKPLNPLVKLVGQMLSIMPFLVGAGLAFPSTTFIVGIPLVLFWVLALTNSFNLLDNMDGLSGGTAAVVGGVLACYSFWHGETITGALSLLITGVCLGFLWYNFRFRGTAKIFMGDCGSMFLGYMLSSLSVIAFCPTMPEPLLHRGAQCLLPLLMMCVPLFDTILVIIRRRAEGRAISQGGKDHSSHRLVYAGCSDKQAVLLLWGISLAGGCAALLLDRMRSPLFPLSTGLTLAVSAVALFVFGGYLSRFTGPRQAVVKSSHPIPSGAEIRES